MNADSDPDTPETPDFNSDSNSDAHDSDATVVPNNPAAFRTPNINDAKMLLEFGTFSHSALEEKLSNAALLLDFRSSNHKVLHKSIP